QSSGAIDQAIVRLHGAVDRDRVQLAVRTDQPPLARRADQRIQDAAVFEQVFRPCRLTPLREVGGRSAHHLAARRDLTRDQVGILQSADPYGDVEAFLDQ